MRAVTFVVPGSLLARTGGSIYDRRMVDGLRALGRCVDAIELAGAFPLPRDADVAAAARALAAVPDGRILIVDGLAAAALADVLEQQASRLHVVPLIHLPLGADVSLARDAAAMLASREQRVLAAATLVIVTGPATMRMLGQHDLPPSRVRVVTPGTDRVRVAERPRRSDVHLVCVATVNAIKGHETLMQALSRVPREYGWRLTCAGSLTRDPATVGRVRAAIAEFALADRVSLAGEIDPAEIAQLCGESDVFVLATRQETYGMAVAEALAHALPVVSTTTGAIPDLVGEDAGLLVPPGDVDRLADALTRVIADASLRTRLAEGARRAGQRLPSWNDACAEMDRALTDLTAHG
jgi:glycosyltransferase involved in cell wall biosynthesis